LTQINPDLNRVVVNFGVPPLWKREPGFGTLVHIILEQQVSLASARATYDKLTKAAGTLISSRFLEFSDLELSRVWFQ
ncbi:MAG: DNA-3-methyladenine glycosylase 2 family protein, partial [Candidatus Thorarchaeota archaeon]|nr:DNA-3-methyladenine glycosylase 2 family protein [Candidatus Thorarchaeota archaeon]